MGILRADRITGLGGANAIKGSVSFPHDGSATTTSGALQVLNVNDALTFGTGDFTIEFWFYTNRIGVAQHLYDGRGTGAGTNVAVLIQISDSNNIRFFTTNAYRITGSSTLKAKTWYHVALTRTGSTHTLYVDGASDGTYSNSGMDYTGPTNNFSAIGSDDNGAGAYGLNGYITNLRIAKELIYSGAFTVPTTELAPTPNTTLICCQSPGNINASFGDPILTVVTKNTNSKGPEASRFTPNSPVGFSTTTDVGSQYGSTFDGFGSFATSTYMVPPGGNTRERNRGRGIISGGGDSSAYVNSIEYISIQSTGNAFDFGDLSSANKGAGATLANETRAVCGGGYGSPINIGSMEFFEIATQSNTTDFGDLVNQIRNLTSLANSTRGIFAGGTYAPGTPGTHFNTIQFITIGTLGDATDFGDMVSGRRDSAALSSPTRGIIAGGNPGSGPQVTDEIDFITIATAGNAQDFGNMTNSEREIGGAASSTRGIIFGGYSSPAFRNTIDFITIATTGNASDFGDLTAARTSTDGCSNKTRAAMCAGSTPTYVNLIDFVTLATTGDAADFGDLTEGKLSMSGCTSDSHGGLG